MERLASLFLAFLVLAAFQVAFANTDQYGTSLQQFFSSPEQTWVLFTKAILEEDYDTAQKYCCHGKAKGVLKFEKMDPQKRKSILHSMKELKKINQQNNKAKYKLIRNSNGKTFSSYVYFEKVDSQWKIESF